MAVFRGLNCKSRDSLTIRPGTDERTEIVALSVWLRFVEDLVQDRRGQRRRPELVLPSSVAER